MLENSKNKQRRALERSAESPMKMNCYYNPVKTAEGKGSLHLLPDLVREAVPHGARILILTWSEQAVKSPVFASLKETCGAESVAVRLFKDSNPTIRQLYRLYAETRSIRPNLIIAVGGGSVMDAGKTLCLMTDMELGSENDLRGIIEKKRYGKPAARWIGIPTTAGTGSEVTCWATVWDPETDVKRSVESKENFAFAAIVDPDLSAGMPRALAVASALDAVAHGVESYWARASNPVSAALALAAISRIMGHMEELASGEKEVGEDMALGSMMAGLAFSNTKTTACHSISYPLTMEYHIPHGAAVGMLLGPVLMLNFESVAEPEPLLKALGIRRPEELSGKIRGIMEAAGLPFTLSGWKVPEQAILKLSSHGMTKGRADNNPQELSEEIIEHILREIY